MYNMYNALMIQNIFNYLFTCAQQALFNELPICEMTMLISTTALPELPKA